MHSKGIIVTHHLFTDTPFPFLCRLKKYTPEPCSGWHTFCMVPILILICLQSDMLFLIEIFLIQHLTFQILPMIVSITPIAFENHSLRSETLASRSAPTKYSWGHVLFTLNFQSACQATARDQTIGSSTFSSTMKSKQTASSTLMPGIYLAMQDKMEAPTPLFPGQCTRSPRNLQ